jgi:hypothetical protein
VSDAAWRAGLEERFVRWLEQDVTHLLPGGPDWAGVTENYGGTAGHHAAFLRSKLAFAQAVHAGADAAEVARLERACLDAAGAFWREWAGYHLTARAGA